MKTFLVCLFVLIGDCCDNTKPQQNSNKPREDTRFEITKATESANDIRSIYIIKDIKTEKEYLVIIPYGKTPMGLIQLH